MILETAVGRKKDAEAIGVNSEIKNFVVTFGVIRHFVIGRGALRACVDFCDSTAVSRLKPMNFLCPPFPFTFEYFDFHLIGTDVDLCEVVITNYTTRICKAELAGTAAVNCPSRPEMTS